jgi:LysM repeat protein
MKTVTVLENQSLFDIAIQYCGTVESIFDIAMLNNISITAFLDPGQKLLVSNQNYGYDEIVDHYIVNKIQPATGGITAAQILQQPDGIGAMRVDSTFRIT